MSGREWKPGDVALVKSLSGVAACVAVRSEGNTWRCEHGPTIDEKVEWIRPLVVIDPESREQVERLLTSIPLRDRIEGVIRCSIDDRTFARIGDHFQAALREFANPPPPKPNEPTGWLAAVVDAEGNRWCISGGPIEPPKEWYSPDLNESRAYADIAAVRVLSEGVSL